jgi:hypothetical protein
MLRRSREDESTRHLTCKLDSSCVSSSHCMHPLDDDISRSPVQGRSATGTAVTTERDDEVIVVWPPFRLCRLRVSSGRSSSAEISRIGITTTAEALQTRNFWPDTRYKQSIGLGSEAKDRVEVNTTSVGRHAVTGPRFHPARILGVQPRAKVLFTSPGVSKGDDDVPHGGQHILITASSLPTHATESKKTNAWRNSELSYFYQRCYCAEIVL